MKYTQNQIDEACDQKEGLQDMKKHLEAVIELAHDHDIPDIGLMAQDMLSDVQTILGSVQEIINWGYRQQVEEEMRDYFAAVM